MYLDKKPELLSPAGNFEKLKAALRYGADAVYIGGKLFGMRSAADNFTVDEIKAACEYAHRIGKKVYLTVNTMPHGDEYPALREYLKSLDGSGLDAMIVADLGVLAEIKNILPEMEIHISTQAGIVSPESALAYVALGAKRVVLARELTLDEIKEIRRALPDDVEIEAFVHGSMCVSYSGRCMLSHHLTGRDANRGGCTQPCRWNYTIVEEKRPDVPLPIEENELGTFIMSSKDMCTVGIIPELCAAGINSFKIEGRMKSVYYTSLVTNAYRVAIDAYFADPENYKLSDDILRELDSVSHREYCTGYYLDLPADEANLCTQGGYIREKAYFAEAPDAAFEENIKNATQKNDEKNENATQKTDAAFDEIPLENEDGRLYLFAQRNKVKLGDIAEIISPGRTGRAFEVKELYLPDGTPVESAPHPSMLFYTRVPFEVKPGDIMRSGE